MNAVYHTKLRFNLFNNFILPYLSSESNENLTEIMTNRSTITNRVNPESALDFLVIGYSFLNYKHETVYTALSTDP